MTAFYMDLNKTWSYQMFARNVIVILIIILFYNPTLKGSDWTQYKGNASRTGYTSEKLPKKLKLRWVLKHKSPPVFSNPKKSRILYDHAFHVVISKGIFYYGSSVDNSIHARELKSGNKIWQFFTDGPVRCAPAIWKNNLYATSDDGHLYCLNAKTGELLWKKRGGAFRQINYW